MKSLYSLFERTIERWGGSLLLLVGRFTGHCQSPAPILQFFSISDTLSFPFFHNLSHEFVYYLSIRARLFPNRMK